MAKQGMFLYSFTTLLLLRELNLHMSRAGVLAALKQGPGAALVQGHTALLLVLISPWLLR